MPPTFHDKLLRQELKISFLSAAKDKKKGYMLVLSAQSKDMPGLSREYTRVVPSNFDMGKVLEEETRGLLTSHISLSKVYDLREKFDEQYESSAVFPIQQTLARTLLQKILG